MKFAGIPRDLWQCWQDAQLYDNDNLTTGNDQDDQLYSFVRGLFQYTGNRLANTAPHLSN
jgi:hypothetical protein